MIIAITRGHQTENKPCEALLTSLDTIYGEVLDATTGSIVAGFPNAYLMISEDGDGGQSFFNVYYKPDSRLIEISGIAADPEIGLDKKVLSSKNRTRYYEFDGKNFRLLKIIDE